MKKVYRISVCNQSTGKRELMYEEYTSRKKAIEMCDNMNNINSNIDAQVVTKIK